jgi:hypothetical protein
MAVLHALFEILSGLKIQEARENICLFGLNFGKTESGHRSLNLCFEYLGRKPWWTRPATKQPSSAAVFVCEGFEQIRRPKRPQKVMHGRVCHFRGPETTEQPYDDWLCIFRDEKPPSSHAAAVNRFRHTAPGFEPSKSTA